MVVHLQVARRAVYDDDLPAELCGASTSRTGSSRLQGIGACAVCSARATMPCASGLTRSKVAERAAWPRSDVVDRDPRTRTLHVAAGVIGSARPRSSRRQLPGGGQCARGRLNDARRNLARSSSVTAGADGAVTRLKDVARIELGASEYALRSLLNNQARPVAIPIFQSPGSNALQISDERARHHGRAARKTCPSRRRPISIVYDPTQFVRASIHAVIETLLDRHRCWLCIVVIVFLQTWRASIIPLLAVPVSVIGTFGGHVPASASRSTRYPSSALCSRSASWSTTRSSSSRTSSATSPAGLSAARSDLPGDDARSAARSSRSR